MSSGSEDGSVESGRRSLVRNSLTSGVGLALSLVSGLVLDAVIAVRFGAGEVTDAFFVAGRIPLGLNLLLLAGATQALTPAFARATTERDWTVPSRVLVVLGAVSLAVCGLLAALARPLTDLTAPGLGAGAAEAAIHATRILFMMVPLVLVAEVLRAVLNVRDRFGAAALMNVVLNVVAISVILVSGHPTTEVLAWAYVIGAGCQLVYVVALSIHSGFRFTPRSWGDGRAAAVGRLSVRPTAASGVNLAARIGEQLALSFAPPGSISIANYANRLSSAIGGLFFRSVTVAALPAMARAAGKDDRATVRRYATDTFRMMVAIALPLTAFTIALAPAAVRVVFRRGEFTDADARLVGLALVIYAFSLVASGAQRAVLTLWLAHLDTRMNLSSAVVGLTVEMALLAVAIPIVGSDSRTAGVVCIALAWSLAQFVVAAYCIRAARRDHHVTYGGAIASLRSWGAVTALATVAMVVVGGLLDLDGADRVATVGGGMVVAGVGIISIGLTGRPTLDRLDLAHGPRRTATAALTCSGTDRTAAVRGRPTA